MKNPLLIPLPDRYEPQLPPESAAETFFHRMATRRTVRMFSDRPVSKQTLEWIVRTAASAPSGANKQPWRFVCVSDPALKRKIRLAAEEEEKTFYESRAGRRWLADLEPLGTDANKEYLEIAPWLIIVLKLTKGDDGSPVYYPAESVGIATGLLLAAAHHAGLATVTHTPSPMGFLAEILERPDHERPFLIVPVGYPSENCLVPSAALQRKSLTETMICHPE